MGGSNHGGSAAVNEKIDLPGRGSQPESCRIPAKQRRGRCQRPRSGDDGSLRRGTDAPSRLGKPRDGYPKPKRFHCLDGSLFPERYPSMRPCHRSLFHTAIRFSPAGRMSVPSCPAISGGNGTLRDRLRLETQLRKTDQEYWRPLTIWQNDRRFLTPLTILPVPSSPSFIRSPKNTLRQLKSEDSSLQISDEVYAIDNDRSGSPGVIHHSGRAPGTDWE